MRTKHLSLVMLLAVFCAAPVWAYTWDGIDFHGFFDQGYMATDGNNYLTNTKEGSFHLTDAALNATRQFNDKWRAGVQIYSYRLGDTGSFNKPFVDWAYVEYQPQSWLGLRVGKVKLSNGLYGDSLDLEMTRPFVFLPTGVYNPVYRELSNAAWGGSIYGNIPLNKSGSLDYTFFAGHLDDPTHSSINWEVSEAAPTDVTHGTDGCFMNGALTWNTPVSGLRATGSLLYVHDLDFLGSFKTADEMSILPPPSNALSGLASIIGGSSTDLSFPNVYITTIGAEYLWKDWTFATEYQRTNTQEYVTVDNPIVAGTPSLNGTQATGSASDAMYWAVSRRITRQLELGSYYSLQFSNLHDRDGSALAAEGDHGYHGFEKDLALVACYKVTPWWLVKAEGHIINGTAGLNNISDNQPWSNTDRYWMLGVLQTTFYF